MLTTNTPEAKNYKDNIIHYNAALAFASRSCNLDPPPGLGPYCMRIHGQVHHYLGGLYPNEGKEPKYAQLYILDSEQAIEQRMGDPLNEKCKPDIMAILDQMLRENNPFYHALHSMNTKLQNDLIEASLYGIPFIEPKMFLNHKVYIYKYNFIYLKNKI